MDNKDTELIFEKYSEVNEGFMDRLRARASGAVGAVKGLGQQAGGYAKAAYAGIKDDREALGAAHQQIQAGKIQGEKSKISSYRDTALSKIDALDQEIRNDLQKLGIPANMSEQAMKTFRGNVSNALENLITGLDQ